ncbi:hypothetical protein Hanom_Chr09g00764421 [Helianthus anomalus]
MSNFFLPLTSFDNFLYKMFLYLSTIMNFMVNLYPHPGFYDSMVVYTSNSTIFFDSRFVYSFRPVWTIFVNTISLDKTPNVLIYCPLKFNHFNWLGCSHRLYNLLSYLRDDLERSYLISSQFCPFKAKV